MRYEFVLEKIAATIGFCTCQPDEDIPLAEAAEYLKAHPMDEFMHRHILRQITQLSPEDMPQAKELADGNPAFASCIAEAAASKPGLAPLIPEDEQLEAHSPLIDLRYTKRKAHQSQLYWSKVLAANLGELTPLPALEQAPDLPYDEATLSAALGTFVHVEDVAQRIKVPGKKEKVFAVEETSRNAEKMLAKSGVRMSNQMRHQMSLAPVGLMRQWKNDVSVCSGSLDYSVFGTHTSFGRALDFESAQAALLMEICERYSSWASIKDGAAVGYRSAHRLATGRYSDFKPGQALDPNTFPIEVKYEDEPLHWINCTTSKGKDILVPAQMIWLFLNLNEPALYSGLGSTGLAAGNTLEQAKVGALLEVIERDAECVTPFDYSQCFRIESSDKALSEILSKYADKGIDIMFQDITPEHGVPCYRAFVVGTEGQVVKGASAKLDGSKAIASAMLEVPYPYPFGVPSAVGPKDIPVRQVEELPNYSTGKTAGDLLLLETLFAESNREPAYANLTRSDLGIPVCRAMVAGMELLADFDKYSTISARMLANCIKHS